MDSSQMLLGLLSLSQKVRHQNEQGSADDSLFGVISRTTLRTLLSSLRYRHESTLTHSRRVAALAVGLAGKLGWDPPQQKQLEIACLLHDVGKIGIPDHILFKPGTRAVQPLLLAMSQQGPETVQRAQRILVQLVADSEAVYLLLESMLDKNNQTAHIAKKVIQTESYQLAARIRHIQKVQSQIHLAQQAVHSKQWKLAITRCITVGKLAQKLEVLDECRSMISEIIATSVIEED